MKLYMDLPTDYARLVIDYRFVGEVRELWPHDVMDAFIKEVKGTEIKDGIRYRDGKPTDLPIRPTTEPIEGVEYCEFRDMPSSGFATSRTTTSRLDVDDEETLTLTFGGGPVLADYVGDFVLSIEVPDDIAREYRIREDPPMGWPFQEFWLPTEVANKYRHTLVVLDAEDGEIVRPDLVGK